MVIFKKIQNVINGRFLRTPGLEFLKKNTQPGKRANHIKFWLNRSSKNTNLKRYFFEPKKNLKTKFNFDFENFNYSFSEEMLESLKQNGIVIIKNALPDNEKNNILKFFEELKTNNYSNYWDGTPTDQSDKSLGKVTRKRGIIDIDKFKILKNYSDLITEEVYGKKVKPSVEMHYIKLDQYEKETLSKGDTYLHTDRFIPHLKLFYTPIEITLEDAPFEYAISSHIIDDYYKNFFKKAASFDETDVESENIINDKVKIIVPENTLYIAFTNGFHKRNAFTKMGSERYMMFLQYVKNFNKLNYIINI